MTRSMLRAGILVLVVVLSAPAGASEIPYHLSGPYSHLNLEIYLIHGPDAVKAGKYVTLAEAMKKEIVTVHETGNVQQLAIENKSKDVAVFVHAGDIVKGGRQDRVLSMDVIIPPRSGKVPLSSFCVESGRWSKRGKETAQKFSASHNMASSRGLKIASKRSRNQGRVWREVARQQDKLNSNLKKMTGNANLDVRAKSSASSMQLTLENKELKQTAEEYTKKLTSILAGKKDVIGFAFLINGEVNNAELYGQSKLFKKLWSRLLNAAVVEAISELGGKDVQDGASLATRRMNTILRITTMFADATAGKPESRDLNGRTRLTAKETDQHLVFETHDKAQKGWIHRNYMNKPKDEPIVPQKHPQQRYRLNNLPQQQMRQQPVQSP
jgi:hypothetical protein